MEELKKMIMGFNTDQLKELLILVGRNHCGTDQELRARVLDLLRLNIPTVERRIRDIHYYSLPSSKKNRKRNPDIIYVPADDDDDRPTIVDLEADDRNQVRRRGGRESVEMPLIDMKDILMLEMSGRRSAFQDYGHPPDKRRVAGLPAAAASSSGKLSLPSSRNRAPDDESHVYPVNPDVKFKPLPFYDVLTVLLRPSSLNRNYGDAFGRQDNRFQFHLSPQEIQDITASMKLKIMIQLRFCLLETTCEQDDCFPPNVSVKINDCVCSLPRVGPSPARSCIGGTSVAPAQGSCVSGEPINISQYCRLTPTKPNDMLVTWSPDFSCKAYALTVHLVRKLDPATLVARLRSKGVSNVSQTKTLIQDRLQLAERRIGFASQMHPVIDAEFLLSLKVSLLCPVSKKRIEIPCRSRDCAPHIQCFDAASYLKLNEKDPTWTCPVCEKPAPYSSMFIDGYMLEALSAFTDCQTVLLNDTGLFKPVFTGAKNDEGNPEDGAKPRCSDEDHEDEGSAKKKMKATIEKDDKGLMPKLSPPAPKKEEDVVKYEPKKRDVEDDVIVVDPKTEDVEVVDLT